MINSLKITNLADAESYSFNKNKREFDVWISVVGEEDRRQIHRMKKNFQEKNVRFFHQFFADWSNEDGIQWKHLEHEAPQKQHIQNIITFLKPFTEDNKPHNLGINCFAGISRSTAVGIMSLVMAGRTVEQALTEVLKVRPIAWPNLRILDFASQILNVDIKTPIAEWKNRCQNSEELFIMPDRLQKED
jgi:predicted protein tyrosine phosphatase